MPIETQAEIASDNLARNLEMWTAQGYHSPSYDRAYKPTKRHKGRVLDALAEVFTVKDFLMLLNSFRKAG